MATQVLRRDSQVEMGTGPEDRRLSALDQDRLASHAIYKFSSALGTPVRLQPPCAGGPPELVGATGPATASGVPNPANPPW